MFIKIMSPWKNCNFLSGGMYKIHDIILMTGLTKHSKSIILTELKEHYLFNKSVRKLRERERERKNAWYMQKTHKFISINIF